MSGSARVRPQRGQSTVEAIAGAPIVAVVGLLCLQALVVGAVAVQADNAAHAAAVAWAESGTSAARDAALRALPGWSRSRVDVRFSGGRARITVRPRALTPLALPKLRSSAPLPLSSLPGATR